MRQTLRYCGAGIVASSRYELHQQLYVMMMMITMTPFFCLYYRYLDFIERAIANGDCLLLENIGESVDPVLDPLLGRLTIKKGKYLKIGDREVEYHPKFRLILQVIYTWKLSS